MAAPQPDTRWIGSPNYRVLNGIPKLGMCMHWMVGNLAGTDASFVKASFGVATTWGIERETIHQYVDAKDYAFGTGDTWANTYLESVEHAGGWLLPDGTRKSPEAATHESSARLAAWRADYWGWDSLVRGRTVFDHNDFINTQCPGDLDIDWICSRGNAIRAAGSWGATTKGGPMRVTQYIQMIDANGSDVADWSRVGADVLPVEGKFPGGYEATSDINVARLWDAAITGGRGPLKMKRDAYIALQRLGLREYDLHRADDLERIREAIGDFTPGQPGKPVEQHSLDSIAKAVVAEFKKAGN